MGVEFENGIPKGGVKNSARTPTMWYPVLHGLVLPLAIRCGLAYVFGQCDDNRLLDEWFSGFWAFSYGAGMFGDIFQQYLSIWMVLASATDDFDVKIRFWRFLAIFV